MQNQDNNILQPVSEDDNTEGYLKKTLIIIMWILIWQIADSLINNRIILAGPVDIISSLLSNIRQPDFWQICLASFTRITVGFLLAFISGFVISMAAYRWKIIDELLSPIISLLKTVPMISFVIMLLIWVGNQALTIYLSFLIVLPLIYTNTLSGLENVDKDMLEIAKVFGLSPFKKFMYIYRPAFMPFLLSSCRVSLGLSWKSGIMAEVIATPKPSIGREMYVAKQYLQTDNLFAWTIVVIILSIIFELVFMFFMKQAARPCGTFIGGKEKKCQ